VGADNRLRKELLSMATSTRDRLLQRALELFHAHGFREVGLDRIFNDVGVTKTTFYKYFESKDDLIVQVLRDRDAAETREWIRAIRRIGGEDARAQLLAFFDLLEDWFRKPDFRGCLFLNAGAEFPLANDPVHQAANEHGRHLFEEIMGLATLAGAKDPESLAKQLLLLITGAIISRHAGGDNDAAVTAKGAADLLLKMGIPEPSVKAAV
jgi:AcrR family transcriptional regulator